MIKLPLFHYNNLPKHKKPAAPQDSFFISTVFLPHLFLPVAKFEKLNMSGMVTFSLLFYFECILYKELWCTQRLLPAR